MARKKWNSKEDFNRNKESSGFTSNKINGNGLKRGYTKGSLTKGLVAYYPMERGEGQVLFDGAHGNHGQIKPGDSGGNTSTSDMWNDSDKVGSNCLSFDGTDDFVNAGDVFSTLNDGSITGWFKISSMSGNEAVYAWRDPDGTDAFEVFVDDGTVRFADERGNDFVSADSTSTYDDGSWHFFAGVSIKGKNATLFVDGVEVASSSISDDSIESDSVDQYIGARNDTANSTTDWYFSGDLDNVAIYDRALSQPEIEALYNLTSPQGRKVTESDVPSQSDSGVSRYPFDGDVNDSWGSNDGTDNTSAGFVDGVFGQAKDFNGTDDRVELPDLGLNSSQSFTFSAWTNMDSGDSSIHGIVSRYDGSDDIIQFQIDARNDPNVVHWRAGHAGSNEISITSNVNDPYESWIHIVGVYDSTGPTLRLYENGSLTAESTGTVDDFDTADGPWIGAQSDGSKYFNGAIDDVRIYDKALSPTEVEQLYSKGAYRINRTDVL